MTKRKKAVADIISLIFFKMGTKDVIFVGLAKIRKMKLTGKHSIKLLASICLVFSVMSIARAQWDKDVLEFRGRLALQDGKYQSAIEQFNILAKLDTNSYWTYFYRGIAKFNLGDLRGAQSDFDHSIRINPIFTNGYHYRAITESRFGEYDLALDDLQRAIELRPGNTGLYFSRGVTYFLSQRFDLAIEDFDKYLRFEKDDPSAYLNRGASYLFIGDTLKALNDYNKAIKLDRFDPEGYIRRARLYAQGNDFELAIEDMNKAIDLDPDNTLAYFNRALMNFEKKNYVLAMKDLDKVLEYEPGNALTLYNRSLIKMQLGDLEGALDDMDRVLNINPNNVLAYFNRAACLIELGRLKSALHDYDRAIELYPDFAKAYQNRSYVENLLGMKKQSKADYLTAQKKIQEYNSSKESGSFADTTRKYNSLISLDAEFAKKDFDDELLQNRDVNIKLKPLYRVTFAESRPSERQALKWGYENSAITTFVEGSEVPVEISQANSAVAPAGSLFGYSSQRADIYFLKGIKAVQEKQYNIALNEYNLAIEKADGADKAFYLMNRAVLKAEMIDFIASIENSVQTLSMDDQGAAKTRVSDRIDRQYDYSEAIEDLLQADGIKGDIAYIHFNLGNLYTLNSQMVKALEYYDKAISEYPQMGNAYYNRALVLIFIKDREKGCIDLSRAGELGIKDAYSVINKYCKENGE